MRKGFNIESSEWCDIVFNNKNKGYGAYALRQSSSKRHVVALGVIFMLMLVVSLLPQLIGAVKDLNRANDLGTMDNVVVVTDIEVDQRLEEHIRAEDLLSPPPPLKSSIKVTPPVIRPDEEVRPEDEMHAVSTVLESTLTVSMADIQGTDEKYGVTLDVLKQNTLITGNDKPKDETPHVRVEVMPQFKGGESELYAFIGKNLKYPVTAQEGQIQGRVIIRFVVTADGDISDVKVLRGIDPSCDKEAVRVVKMMPKWIPGKQNGRNVPVYFTLPVVYKLQ